MKIDRVVLKGFLSHEDTEWSPNGARLVALVGQNGAGKSSLAVDALLYALFDDARGRTDDLVQLGRSEMSVLVEFTFGDQRYRVSRGRSRRSGGKSFLEFHIADGETWRPLTEPDMRTTQARIGELLRMDPATFETAALLVQGRANRFAEATPGERKRVLATVLGLDIYERAEARAREIARDFERNTESAHHDIERLELAMTEFGNIEDVIGAAAAEMASLDDERIALTKERAIQEEDLRALAGKVAEAAASLKEVDRLVGAKSELEQRWRRADEQRKAAVNGQQRAQAVLIKAGSVEVVVATLPKVRAIAAAQEQKEEQQRGRQAELERARERLAEARQPYEAAVADFEAHRATVQHRISELESAVAGLAPVECPKCGERFAADPADLAGRLEVVRQELLRLGPPPKEPVAVARYRGIVARCESVLREIAFDPAELRRTRDELMAAERMAAQAGQMSDAREALAAAQAAETAAQEDLDAVTEAGKKAADELKSARARADEAEQLQRRQMQLKSAIATSDVALATVNERHSAAASRMAAFEERRDNLAKMRTRRDELVKATEADGVEARRYRRLSDAFGVTGIPARIIESVLPGLAEYANELLADLRPGMTLELRAQRAKKSGGGIIEALDLVVRDDVGGRPLAMFSGGERMSVSLALAVGLSRLVARRAGTAIRTLVVDEPDGLDADARRQFGQALRVLAHRGELERIVLVSHHQDLAEYGDAVYRVSRNGHGSVVELEESAA